MKPADSEKRNGKCTLSDHNLVINGGWVGGYNIYQKHCIPDLVINNREGTVDSLIYPSTYNSAIQTFCIKLREYKITNAEFVS